eukprot:1161325-Pelagomonas_calceolata.AAC.11
MTRCSDNNFAHAQQAKKGNVASATSICPLAFTFKLPKFLPTQAVEFRAQSPLIALSLRCTNETVACIQSVTGVCHARKDASKRKKCMDGRMEMHVERNTWEGGDGEGTEIG